MKYITIGWKTLDMQLLWNSSVFILLCFITVSIQSCKKNGKPIDQTNESAKIEIPFDQKLKPLPIDFMDFYNKFHSDSMFQIEHIVFPLKGLPDHADPEDVKDEDYYYTSDQWVFQKRCDPQKNTINYINMADIIIEERIEEKEHKLMVIRRFAKTSGGWTLIYYAGLNKYNINSAGE